MKTRNLTALSLAILLLTGCNNGTKISNGTITLRYNDRMEIQVTSNNPSTEPYCSSFAAADALIADEAVIDSWRLTSADHVTDAKGAVYTLHGEYKRNGYDLEKIQTVTAPDGFNGMLLIETEYVNHGDKSLLVKAVESNKLSVESDETIWSFQPSSSSSRKDWILPVDEGFSQRNFLGMNNCDYGGGIPMVTLWRRDGGISTGLVEPVLKLVSMPVERVRYGKGATMALRRDYDEGVEFAKGDTIATESQFISVSTGDFYNPLEQFTQYMERYEGYVPSCSEPEAFEPVWCAWGYERSFTIGEVLGTLPKVKELGFTWVDVDDGYQIAEGDWRTNSRFNGDRDMRRLTDAIHSYGMKAKIWWAPMAADPNSMVLREHPETMLLTEEWVPEYISYWDSYYLSPVNDATIDYTLSDVDRFISRWNFDGLKLDGQHLNLCEPDHNDASNLDYPEQAVEQFPTFFKAIYDRAREIKPYAVVQLCPCGCAINFFNIPYMNQAVASDPTSSAQIRMKCKAYKAINPQLAYYADHVELSDGGTDFATQIGIGGVLGSKFTWPKDNPNVRGSYLLTPEKEVLYKKWVALYKDKMLSKGEYLNLYDMGFDAPEAHVIAKEGKIYYAFYAEQWNGEPIELRGLDAAKSYTVTEYTSDTQKSYKVGGKNPHITPTFTGNYLIEVSAD